MCSLQAWLLALLGAQKDSRLSLMHLGRAHHQGDRGLPADQDLAYAYYGNIAKQTSLDRLKTSPEQVTSPWGPFRSFCGGPPSLVALIEHTTWYNLRPDVFQ